MGNSQATRQPRLTPREALDAFGAEVRELRQARRMTLAELAEASGVSVSHLSAIERGAVNPTLEKISRIADGLRVPEEWFFSARPGAGPLERAYVVRRENRRNLNLFYDEGVKGSGSSDALLSSSIGGAFHMGISDYAPATETVVEAMYVREGEQHGFVLEGELELTMEDEVVTIREGDSFSYPGHVPHRVRNRSGRPARMIWANSPVIIPKFETLPAVDGMETAEER